MRHVQIVIFDERDAAQAESLYRLLEEQIVPAFYERDEQGVPRTWLKTVKEAIRTVTPWFSARRMVKQYTEESYVPMLRGMVLQSRS